MELKFRVFAHVSRPVAEVFEAVVDPGQLSNYFTTGGATGRIEEGAVVTWDFADFPGAFPVQIVEVVPHQRIVLEWDAAETDQLETSDRSDMADAGYRTTVTMSFKPVDGDAGRTLVEIAEEGWRETERGLKASYGNCMGWSQMLAALKVWLEHGINLREGMYR